MSESVEARPVIIYFGIVTAIEKVLATLDAPRHKLRDALPTLPPTPGLYAIYGDESAWAQLRLGEPHPNVALYVGKAEDSLV